MLRLIGTLSFTRLDKLQVVRTWEHVVEPYFTQGTSSRAIPTEHHNYPVSSLSVILRAVRRKPSVALESRYTH